MAPVRIASVVSANRVFSRVSEDALLGRNATPRDGVSNCGFKVYSLGFRVYGLGFIV